MSRHLEQTLGVPPLIRLNGKAPLDTGWTTGPRRKPNEWRRRLADHTGNVGMVTGDGLVVVDVDLYHAGRRRLDRRAARPRAAERDGDGDHRRRRPASAVPHHGGDPVPAARRLSRASTSRARAAMIVVPPSVHPDTGRPYEWEHGWGPGDVEPAELPERHRRAAQPSPTCVGRVSSTSGTRRRSTCCSSTSVATTPASAPGCVEVTRPGKDDGLLGDGRRARPRRRQGVVDELGRTARRRLLAARAAPLAGVDGTEGCKLAAGCDGRRRRSSAPAGCAPRCSGGSGTTGSRPAS